MLRIVRDARSAVCRTASSKLSEDRPDSSINFTTDIISSLDAKPTYGPPRPSERQLAHSLSRWLGVNEGGFIMAGPKSSSSDRKEAKAVDYVKTSQEGQGVDVLEKRGWGDLPERVIVVSYSVSRSLRTAAIWRSSNSLKRRPRHRSAARTRAPNISLSTAFSPKPLGMIFSRRRSSTNRRSRRFVVRVARRCVTGKRRWALP